MKSEKFLIRNPKITLFLLSSMIILNVTNAPAYTPPIGIPDPGKWGTTHPIDGVAPSTSTKCPNWPSAQTVGCYYIDNTNPNATDTSNTYGYPNKPRRTISAGNNPTGTYAAGSYIEVHGGPYPLTNQWVIMQGTAENPIWFRGTPEAMPVFTGDIMFKDATYLFVENIEFNGGTNGCIIIYGESFANNVVVRNSKFKNRTWTWNTSALGAVAKQGTIIHDFVYYNNEFSELGDWETEGVDQDFHGVTAETFGRTPPTSQYNVWLLNSSFSHLSGDAIQVIASTAEMIPYLHHIYIGNNVSHALRQASFWSKQASDVIISQNLTYNNKNHDPQSGTGIGCQYGPNNVWVIFNTIYDSVHGFRQSDTSPNTGLEGNKVYIIGNKIYDIHEMPNDPGDPYTTTNPFKPGQGISLWSGVVDRYIIDNTIYDVNGGVNSNQPGPVVMSGNVISKINPLDYDVSAFNSYSTFTLNNNFFQSGGRFRWGGNAYTSLAAFTAATGQCSNCWTGDPLFVDPANYDLRPQAGSPLIGKGSRHAVYDIFQARYGLSIAYDMEGKPRPSSGGWTLGAYEGASEFLPSPTLKKINLGN